MLRTQQEEQHFLILDQLSGGSRNLFLGWSLRNLNYHNIVISTIF